MSSPFLAPKSALQSSDFYELKCTAFRDIFETDSDTRKVVDMVFDCVGSLNLTSELTVRATGLERCLFFQQHQVSIRVNKAMDSTSMPALMEQLQGTIGDSFKIESQQHTARLSARTTFLLRFVYKAPK